MPLTKQRIETYLKTLAECGVPTWAALAASQHRTNGTSAMSSFIALRKRDPEGFGRREADAMAVANARLEKVAMDRSINGMEEPLTWRGEIIGTKRTYDNKLLAFMLSRRMRDTYGDKREVEVTGSVNHQHSAAPISVADLNRLSPEQRKQLKEILSSVTDARALPAPDDDESEVIDGEFDEVEVEGEH